MAVSDMHLALHCYLVQVVVALWLYEIIVNKLLLVAEMKSSENCKNQKIFQKIKIVQILIFSWKLKMFSDVWNNCGISPVPCVKK